MVGALAEAEQSLREALRTAERLGLTSVLLGAKYTLSSVLCLRGSLPEAVELARAAVRGFDSDKIAARIGGARTELAQILAASGDLRAAEAEADGAQRILEGLPSGRAYALAVLARVRLLAGEPAEALLAARATATLNTADLARSARIAVTTLNRYLTLLQATFLLQPISAWSSNLSSRLVKSPKLLLNDSGILATLTGMSEAQLETSPTAAGMLIENFVGMELMKLASWSQTRPKLFYFRTHDGKEVRRQYPSRFPVPAAVRQAWTPPTPPRARRSLARMPW